MEKFSEALAEKAADKEAQLDAEYKKVNELKEYFVPRLVIGQFHRLQIKKYKRTQTYTT